MNVNDTLWWCPPDSERSGLADSNEWFIYRADLNVADQACAALRVAADSKYWLYVNGELKIREGGLKRGPVPDGSYMETVRLDPPLPPGRHTVVVLLCYFGRHGFSHRDSGLPGLLIEPEGAACGPWKVKRHPAFFDAGYVHDAYRLPEGSEGFDARYDLTGWTTPEFDDSAWPDAESRGKAGAAPWGPLELREFPPWSWSEPREYESVEARPAPSGDGSVYYHCALPYNAHFVPGLTIEAKAGIRIEVTVVQDTNCLSPAYITRAGQQSHEFRGWMNGETVIYKVPSNAVKVVALHYRETHYPAPFVGAFTCNDPLLDRLWEKARRTLYVTMRDNFMDCPCRERAQWPGDMVVQLGQVPYALDRTADLLVKKGLRETLRWQRPDGTIYGPVPEGNWRVELPAQMLSVISEYGIWTYYQHTGDRATIEELYPYAKRYFDLWTLQDSGLINYRPAVRGGEPQKKDGVETGVWDWIDWGERIDAEPSLNAWYILAARGIEKMARELGRGDEAQEAAQHAARVTAAARAAFWQSDRGGYATPDFPHAPDDRVQALMALSGIAEPAQYPALRKVLATVEQACPYMEKYVLEALFKMGAADEAVRRMQHRYRGLVESANSTLWERWPEWSDHPGTINHSWSGGPLTLLCEQVAGLRPLSPGWQRFLVAPAPGTLSAFRASLRAPVGDIEVTGQQDGDGWQVDVRLPEGTEMETDFSLLKDARVRVHRT